ncbi:Bug family tripartite tricarboxylate transporter substrate binding protein [Hydrogenophaga sp. BPS33]|uniref:Bug family tripartite tricarboxylate transporter substrate binding protein n=1 Tax=Hydrogenophaga sp. BPS33 TaxID=2651974 RepID=UPI00131FF5F2|nr:tripartite tricarboxylate transporter substrate binding protein [Hydrogenophaga sp. BPS33]QHE84852.1 tripartite tricarboxylate transporter substrate binding protein [Hydrogenophaga sp. BPS33]
MTQQTSHDTDAHVSRRTLLGSAAATAITLTFGGHALAQGHDAPLKIAVGFPPGGSGDLFARILADALREEISRPIVVENKPGGGGMTVAVGFLRAPKDGTQLMLATGSTAIAAPVSRAKPPYNPVEDFQWIALLSNAPFVIAVNAALPVNTLPELVAYCKARPGALSYGHAGLGTTVHLAAELFKDRAGIAVQDIAYPGSAPAITDTIAGNVQFIVETTGTLGPHQKSGRLRIISCMAEQREAIAPQVPTSREAGYDLIAGTCNLLAAPQGTPPQVIEPIAQAVVRIMTKPAIQEKLMQLGITPITRSGPQEARAFVTSEVARWSAVTKKLGIAL